jgi:membrane protein
MASLRDAATVLRKLGPRHFIQRLWNQVDEDNVFAWASSLSYSWILALFPFLIFLLSLIPYLPDAAKHEAKLQIAGVIDTLPKVTAKTLEDFVNPRLDDLLEKERKGLLTVGILITLWAASGGIAATTTALDKAWDVDGRRSFFRRRISAVTLTLIVSVLLMVVLFLLPIGTQVLRFVAEYTPAELKPALILLNVVRWTLGIAVMFLVIEVVYFFGPNVRQRWRFVSPGSLFCALVWVGLGLAFRFYVDRFGKYNETYGAVGGVAVLLLVFYFDALALLIGAEINSEIAFELLGVPRGSSDFTRRSVAAAPPVTSA